jgi:hypothetical protein
MWLGLREFRLVGVEVRSGQRIVVQIGQWGVVDHSSNPPASKLRERFVWLRNVRYAMRFHPSGSHVTEVTLYSADGKVIDRLAPIEGAFTGPGV